MIKPTNITNQSCCGILYSLEFANLIGRQTIQKTITEVQSTRNKSVDKNLCSIKAEKFLIRLILNRWKNAALQHLLMSMSIFNCVLNQEPRLRSLLR